MPTHRTALDRRYVLVAFVLQVLGYAALVAVSTHGGPTQLVALVGGLPTVVGIALGVFAVPAVLVTVALGAALGVVGVSLQGLGVGLVTGSDLPFLAVAAVLSVVLGRVLGARRRPAGRADE